MGSSVAARQPSFLDLGGGSAKQGKRSIAL
jgi:hypothetical protein